jgi:hypothetical protein
MDRGTSTHSAEELHYAITIRARGDPTATILVAEVAPSDDGATKGGVRRGWRRLRLDTPESPRERVTCGDRGEKKTDTLKTFLFFSIYSYPKRTYIPF